LAETAKLRDSAGSVNDFKGRAQQLARGEASCGQIYYYFAFYRRRFTSKRSWAASCVTPNASAMSRITAGELNITPNSITLVRVARTMPSHSRTSLRDLSPLRTSVKS